MSSPGSKTYRSRLTMIIVSNSKHSQTIRINCVSGPKQERLIKLYRCKKQTNIQVTFEGMFKKNFLNSELLFRFKYSHRQ